MRQSRRLKLAAIGTWAVCGLPAIAAIARTRGLDRIAIAWGAAYAAYGVALVFGFRYRERVPRLAITLLAIQSASAIALTHVTAVDLDGSGVGLLAGVGLLVIVAAQIPHLAPPAVGWLWIAAQTLMMTLAITGVVAFADLVTFGLGSAGFQTFACLTTALMLREASARADLARANMELHATRALLAENSRAGERLRIARDLHDTLGHHLTALSLQLDVASRLTEGRASDHVSRAHAITRLLLAEVRSVVGEMRDRGHTDLGQAIRSLAAAAGALHVHLDIPDRMTLDDSAQALSLLRCIQEIITNAARHAHARNLWIRIALGDGGIELDARDDGRGVDAVQVGNGLKGMRERFAEYSGRVEFDARSGGGFEVHGFMPTAQVTS